MPDPTQIQGTSRSRSRSKPGEEEAGSKSRVALQLVLDLVRSAVAGAATVRTVLGEEHTLLALRQSEQGEATGSKSSCQLSVAAAECCCSASLASSALEALVCSMPDLCMDVDLDVDLGGLGGAGEGVEEEAGGGELGRPRGWDWLAVKLAPAARQVGSRAGCASHHTHTHHTHTARAMGRRSDCTTRHIHTHHAYSSSHISHHTSLITHFITHQPSHMTHHVSHITHHTPHTTHHSSHMS